jgi:kynureninase
MNGFSLTFGREGAPLHVAAHSHHPWPDVSFEAQQNAWMDAAHRLDRKWEFIFADVIPAAQAHVARQLGLPEPSSIAFGPNTHSFLLRILSCLPSRAPLRVLTTDGEFMSFSRQLARLEEDHTARVVRVPTEPFSTFEARFAAEATKGNFDLVYFSQVFFDSGFAAHDLSALVSAVRDHATYVVVDGYHGFMALPTELGAIAGRAFYIAGGYKYAMAGEGACFLHCPPGYGLRPRNTGWYAGFSALERNSTTIQYARDGSRFLGATFDPTALYRFNVVQEWLVQQNLTVERMLSYVRAIEREFLTACRSTEVCSANLAVPDEAMRGRFLAFRTNKAAAIVEHLATRNIIADHRGDRLRIGFGIYHTAEDAQRLAEALA